MKREIKFRVYDISNKRIVHDIFLWEPWSGFIEENKAHAPFIFYETYTDFEDGIKRDCQLMEFTGLKDKNGKEIYEGDVVRISDDGATPLRKIEHFKGGFWFMAIKTDWKFPINMIIEERLSQYEIIGNIYENPELLK